MKNVLKKVFFIILSTLTAFLVMCVLGIIVAVIHIAVIQRITGMLWLYIGVTALFLHPVLVITVSPKIERLIEKYCKSLYTNDEWLLIRMDNLLAQLAGVTITFPLIISSGKLNFAGFGGMCTVIIIFGVILGMGVPLGFKLFDICTTALYLGIQIFLRNKKEKKKRVSKNNIIIVTLLTLAALMCILIFISIPLGKKLMIEPTSEEVLEKKTKTVLENMDYIETIRRYIESLDYEMIMACGEVMQKVDSLNAHFYKEKNYGCLYLSAEEILHNIGLNDKDVVDLEGTVQVEFDMTTYVIRKMSIAIGYIPWTQGTLMPVRLTWYCTGYYDRKPEYAVLDDNWQIEGP